MCTVWQKFSLSLYTVNLTMVYLLCRLLCILKQELASIHVFICVNELICLTFEVDMCAPTVPVAFLTCLINWKIIFCSYIGQCRGQKVLNNNFSALNKRESGELQTAGMLSSCHYEVNKTFCCHPLTSHCLFFGGFFFPHRGCNFHFAGSLR